MTTPSAADIERILDYLDGRLSERDAILHELRLAEDAALRAEHEAFERMDLIQRVEARRRSSRHETPPTRHRRRWVLALPAAALAALAAVGLRSLWTGPGAPGFDLAVVASAPTLLGHNEELGLAGGDERKVPAGHANRGADLTVVSDEEYLALVADLDHARMDAALAGEPRATRAGNFVLPVRTRRDGWAVVLLFTDDGRVVGARAEASRIAFPPEEAGDAGGFVAGGRVQVLPGENVVRVADDAGTRLEYRPGFLVPRRAGRVHAVVGLRAEPLDDGLRAELEAGLESSGVASGAEAASRWQRRLEEHGFRTRAVIVLEE